jgi:hypothetical protein
MPAQEAADAEDEQPPAGLALPGAVWNGGQGGGDGGEEEEGLGALEERPHEAQSSNASGSEAGLVSDYSKVGGGWWVVGR